MLISVLLASCILFLWPVLLKGETEDVIYLKNGEVYRGQLLNEPDSDTLRILTAARNVKIAPRQQLRKVTSEKVPSVQHFKSSGYYFQTGLSVMHNPDDGTPHSTQQRNYRIEIINGYQFNRWFSAGLGAGILKYPNVPLYLIPVFADITARLANSNTAPFVFARGGYVFTKKSKRGTGIIEHSGEYTLNAGAGIRFDSDRDYGWYIKGGYNVDDIVFTREIGVQTVKNHNSYRTLSLGVGVSF